MSETNPFESPQTSIEPPSKRSEYCRQLLKIRKSNGQFFGLIAIYWRKLLLMILILGSLSAYLLWYSHPFGMFMAGMSVGAILRQFAHLRGYSRFWPMTNEIVDWNKVEYIAGGVESN